MFPRLDYSDRMCVYLPVPLASSEDSVLTPLVVIPRGPGWSQGLAEFGIGA